MKKDTKTFCSEFSLSSILMIIAKLLQEGVKGRNQYSPIIFSRYLQSSVHKNYFCSSQHVQQVQLHNTISHLKTTRKQQAGLTSFWAARPKGP